MLHLLIELTSKRILVPQLFKLDTRSYVLACRNLWEQEYCQIHRYRYSHDCSILEACFAMWEACLFFSWISYFSAMPSATTCLAWDLDLSLAMLLRVCQLIPTLSAKLNHFRSWVSLHFQIMQLLKKGRLPGNRRLQNFVKYCLKLQRHVRSDSSIIHH